MLCDIRDVGGLKFAFQRLVLKMMVNIFFNRKEDYTWMFACATALIGLSTTKQLSSRLEMHCVSAFFVRDYLRQRVRHHE